MSVWKKAAKANQKTHRERHQPEARKHLGLLEKKKDYKKRATDYNEKQATLKLLRKRALNKNPDEFYHHMINSKLENGMHFEKETEDEDTVEQIRLMRTQDIKYIITKRTQELKKIEKLQAQLHLTSINFEPQNKHVYFTENLDEPSIETELPIHLMEKELPDVDIKSLQQAVQNRKALYQQLSKRIEREKELAIIQRKIEIKRHLQQKTLLKPKRLRKGSKSTAPVYVWKYERKK
ncbi:u3 small nucleolar rna-associated protein 11 [Holotrichia oblita]|uniref:U3 small nucleolar rna-associated protein 11 n=1 Tax=Holotrichia oblita TaxID=644536 RepID=A0ACB9SY01_HOLOL|nr:u3 small nucleolar rna-associated protein 11 [Holotrichia oblita]